ncbi:MAG: hypothetical protein LBF88_14695, partial [Planctomycetaceae bacterium]|nr:hypothetical protein [Planctomycetaceae bacterium]
MEKPQQNDNVKQLLRIDKAELLKSKQWNLCDIPALAKQCIPALAQLCKVEAKLCYYLLCPNCGDNLKKKDEDDVSHFHCPSCNHIFRIWTEDLTIKFENSQKHVPQSASKDMFSLIVLIYDCIESGLENDSLNDEVVDYLLKSDTWYSIQQFVDEKN